MAKENLDELLGALRDRPVKASLDGLESAVWARIEESRRAQGSGGFGVQLAAVAMALALGVVVGGVTAERRPIRSEMVVLSEDASLAPSVAVEGGA